MKDEATYEGKRKLSENVYVNLPYLQTIEVDIYELCRTRRVVGRKNRPNEFQKEALKVTTTSIHEQDPETNID